MKVKGGDVVGDCLGVACGGASAIMLAVAYLIWIAPCKKLDRA